MNERVLVLRDAVVKITQMLSGKGIRVTQQGVSAYVKADHMGRPIVVNLPYLPDNSTDELCNAIQGFLDHEVAHIMFSDFSLLSTAQKLGCMGMLNILEDARIEKAMGKKFAGCSHNLTVTGKFFLDKYTTPKYNEAVIAGDVNKLVGVLMVPLIRSMSGQFIFTEYMADKLSSMKPVIDKIADLQEKIENASSTQECLDLAQEIEKRLRDPGKPNGGKGKTPEDKGSGAESTDPKAIKGKPSKGKSKDEDEEEESKSAKSKSKEKDEEESKPAKSPKSKGKSAKSDEEEDEEESPEEDEGEGEESPSEDEDDDEGEGDSDEEESPEDESEDEDDDESISGSSEEDESEEDDDDSDEDEMGGGEAELGDEDSSEDSETELGSDTAAIMDEIDKENANGYEDKMSSVISSESLIAAKHADYLIFTKDFDVIEPLKVGRDYRPEMFKVMADKVDHMVGPLQKDLERAIAARSLSTWEAGRRSGRIHSANLSRLAAGDSRVFRRKHESTSKDVAVTLVIDASGSMSGEKIHLATESAYALSSVLERIGIKHEVVCFTTGMPDDMAAIDAEVRKIGRGFSRVEPLYMPIIKSFDERLNAQIKERFGWLPNSRILRNNIDGECIEVAARRLKSRREAGKAMIVLSDGMPNAHGDTGGLNKHLKQVVKDVTKSGVNIVGLGIMTDAVERFYPKHLVINNVNELPDRVIKELRHLLVHN